MASGRDQYWRDMVGYSHYEKRFGLITNPGATVPCGLPTLRLRDWRNQRIGQTTIIQPLTEGELSYERQLWKSGIKFLSVPRMMT